MSNPYFDQQPVRAKPIAQPTSQPIIDVPPPPPVGDSGMPGWMMMSAPFLGLALFGIAAFVGLTTGAEAPPTQAAHQTATQPDKTNAPQPQATAQKAQTQQQNQQALAPAQGAPPAQTAQPNAGTPNPTATTGAAPKQQ